MRQFDALHHLVRDEHVAWSEALPDLDAPGPQVADALDHAPVRLVALYAPTGLATEQRPVDDCAPYPRTWAGYLKHPGTGLYDAGARLYDPASGLFLEPDPVLPVPDAPETWSRYGYALGDPVGGWDPDGRCAVDFSWEYFVRVECAHLRDFLFKDLPAIDRAAGRGVVAAFHAALDVVLTVGGALACGVGIDNDATAARAEHFANGIVALAHAATNYDETFAALVGGTARGFRSYFDDLANGREERAAENAARFAAEVELALIPTGAAALHLRNVAKARAGGVLTSVRRAAAHVSPPSPVVPRPTAARGSSWVLDDNLSVDLSGFERGSIAARGGVAEPIVVLNRVDGSGRGGFAPKGGAKRGPQPFGTGPHNLKIRDVADSITDGRIIGGGQRPGLPEAVIPTPGGFKSGRRPDILVQRPDGSVYGINVGKQNTRTGAPIRREAEAISDLEGAGIEMHFVPYN